MTEKLRDELLRIGDGVPSLHVPGDVWARGRRLRRRDRAVTGVAAMSVVALICAISLIGWPGTGRDDALPVTRTEGPGAVPAMLYGVPERLASHLEDGTVWSDKVAETDLAIGRGSVAFATGRWPLPVVVTATDGAYHPVALPGWIGTTTAGAMMSPDVPLALSPDGRHLAYGWVDFSAGTVAGSGVRVLDLETGTARTIVLEGGAGVAPHSLGWSPDSRWLVWSGLEAKNWSKTEFGSDKEVAGRVAPGATTSEPLAVTREPQRAFAIASNGDVISHGQSGRLEVVPPSGPATVVFDLPGRGTTSMAVASPDGSHVALGTFEQRSSASFLRPPAPGVEPDVLERELAKDLDLYPGGASVQPLGWLDDRLVLVEVTPASSSDPSYGRRHLVVMTAPHVPEDDWTYRIVTRFADDAAQTSAVSVAVDLMELVPGASVDLDSGQPTADFPPPDWPWSDERKAVVCGLLALVALGGLLLGWLWFRMRRRALR